MATMNKNGTAATASEKLDELKENVRTQAGVLKERAVDLKNTVVERGGDTLTKVSDLIKEHPIAAIGVAFGIGYITVRMLRK